MSYTPLETKLREMMQADPVLPTLVTNGFFDLQLPQGLTNKTPPITAMTVQRVSTQRMSMHSGPSGAVTNITPLALVRIQFTAWCTGPSSNSAALAVLNALVNFLNTFDATSTREFGSPPLAALHFPSQILDERVTLYAPTQPPIYTGILDARLYNREDL